MIDELLTELTEYCAVDFRARMKDAREVVQRWAVKHMPLNVIVSPLLSTDPVPSAADVEAKAKQETAKVKVPLPKIKK